MLRVFSRISFYRYPLRHDILGKMKYIQDLLQKSSRRKGEVGVHSDERKLRWVTIIKSSSDGFHILSFQYYICLKYSTTKNFLKRNLVHQFCCTKTPKVTYWTEKNRKHSEDGLFKHSKWIFLLLPGGDTFLHLLTLGFSPQLTTHFVVFFLNHTQLLSYSLFSGSNDWEFGFMAWPFGDFC